MRRTPRRVPRDGAGHRSLLLGVRRHAADDAPELDPAPDRAGRAEGVGMRLYHGGAPGLVAGDDLIPSPPKIVDDCPICVARREGRIYTVGEYRSYLAQFGDRAAHIVRMLGDAPDFAPIDPPSGRYAVYLTTDRDYARWYAARSDGDLYQVEPDGDLTESTEDPFLSFTAPKARVVAVIERRVRLDRKDRRALFRRWKRVDDRQARERRAA
jgi:hypothetical protein